MQNLSRRVAVVHDWLVVNGGAEKVLENILNIYPEADIFTLVDFLPEQDRGWLEGRNICTSFIQKLPFSKQHYRNYFPLFPIAIEQLDVTQYDLVVSSSYAVAKGVITGPEQTHICYCHSPARYAWDLQFQYLKESNMTTGLKSRIARYFLHKFRIWDTRTSNGVDVFVANSHFIKKRIYKCYRRDADVIFPPVDVSQFALKTDKQDFYLTASRMVPYKRIDLIVSAFCQMPARILKVIGDGPEMEKILKIAKGHDNIEILGFQSNEMLVSHLQNAKAFVFAAEEDFGIIPVEAQACGTPVLAFGKGGCLETVKDKLTGLLFAEQTENSIIDAVNRFDSSSNLFDAEEIRSHAETFSSAHFQQCLKALITKELSK
jgi:glycosyltransferase involved in cell wall biosynthesis